MAAPAGSLIYGANGYTGRLCVEEAARRGERPIVAGRRRDAIASVASEHGLEHRVVALDDAAGLAAVLAEVRAVLHCAGPFSRTSAPMVEACLRAGVHYLDVTGELDVFEAVYARDAEARDRGVSLFPGAGFDVVPTECLAAMLHARLPDATELEIAVAGGAGISGGTAKTAMEILAAGPRVRVNGEIVVAPGEPATRRVPFSDRPRTVAVMGLGEVSAAFRSTRIPNISVFHRAGTSAAVRSSASRKAMSVGPARRLAQEVAGHAVRGPTREERERARMRIWARVAEPGGRAISATLDVPDGYAFTATLAMDAAARAAAGTLPPGALAPSQALGAEHVLRFPGVELRLLEE